MIVPFLPHFRYWTDERLSWVNLTCEHILKIIQVLDSSKAHGHDGVSMSVLKLSSLF